MNDSGIARRVDQLGRIVLPMEIRKKLKIVEGTLLNLSYDNGLITLEKYSPLLNFKEYVEDVLTLCDNFAYLVCDDANVIIANKCYKTLVNSSIDVSKFANLKMGEVLNERLELCDKNNYHYHILLQISKDGDNYGYILFSFENVPSEELLGQCKFICKYISSKL